MAMIKCPECGQDVSDKAPFCPHCGVEIAGKEPLNDLSTQNTFTTKDKTGKAPHKTNPKDKKPKKNYALILGCFIFAFIVCAIGFLFYLNQLHEKERQAYEYAMTSNDTVVLRNFLDTYPDADMEHRGNIMSRMQQAIKQEQSWTNAVVSNSVNRLREYLRQYPNSLHQYEAEERIDSLDWVMAKIEDTAEAYKKYLDEHAEGAYYTQAEENLRKCQNGEVRPEESQMVRLTFGKFFQSINTRDEEGLIATCEDVLTSFLDKPIATKSDVVSFMRKIYKPDISNMNWLLGNDFEISKREVGDEEYEYQVSFSARQVIGYTEASQETRDYMVNGKVSPGGKISEMNMKRIMEQ